MVIKLLKNDPVDLHVDWEIEDFSNIKNTFPAERINSFLEKHIPELQEAAEVKYILRGNSNRSAFFTLVVNNKELDLIIEKQDNTLSKLQRATLEYVYLDMKGILQAKRDGLEEYFDWGAFKQSLRDLENNFEFLKSI